MQHNPAHSPFLIIDYQRKFISFADETEDFQELIKCVKKKSLWRFPVHQFSSVTGKRKFIKKSLIKTSSVSLTHCTYKHEHITMISPSLRHWRIRPPEDMFFSASISLKLRELENTNVSTITMRRERKVMAISEDMPWVASMLFNSALQKQKRRHQ